MAGAINLSAPRRTPRATAHPILPSRCCSPEIHATFELCPVDFERAACSCGGLWKLPPPKLFGYQLLRGSSLRFNGQCARTQMLPKPEMEQGLESFVALASTCKRFLAQELHHQSIHLQQMIERLGGEHAEILTPWMHPLLYRSVSTCTLSIIFRGAQNAALLTSRGLFLLERPSTFWMEYRCPCARAQNRDSNEKHHDPLLYGAEVRSPSQKRVGSLLPLSKPSPHDTDLYAVMPFLACERLAPAPCLRNTQDLHLDETGNQSAEDERQ